MTNLDIRLSRAFELDAQRLPGWAPIVCHFEAICDGPNGLI